MSAWITDRVPTREDADCMTMVWVSSPREVYRCDYRVIKLGTPWQPITYPEPYVKPKVWTWGRDGVVLCVYKNRDLLWTIYGHELTDRQAQAMTDALNKLEDSHD